MANPIYTASRIVADVCNHDMTLIDGGAALSVLPGVVCDPSYTTTSQKASWLTTMLRQVLLGTFTKLHFLELIGFPQVPLGG